MANNWYYEKFDENLNLVRCPQDDKDRSVTGKYILNVPAYFDENPDERIRLGWTKHITHDESEIDYNRQTQFLVKGMRQIDAYTVEDVYNVLTKSEDQLAFEEMLAVAMWGDGGFVFY